MVAFGGSCGAPSAKSSRPSRRFWAGVNREAILRTAASVIRDKISLSRRRVKIFAGLKKGNSHPEGHWLIRE